MFHANRLRLYAEAGLNVTEELLDTVENNDPHLNKVEQLLSLRYNSATERYEVEVKWKEFDYEAPTWEPFGQMQEDIPDKLAQFLGSYHDQEMAAAAKSSHQAYVPTAFRRRGMLRINPPPERLWIFSTISFVISYQLVTVWLSAG